MYGGIKMKMLSAFIFVVCTLFTNALLAESKIFVDSASAEKAIRDTYGAMRTKYDKQYFIESTDDEILENTLKEYNHMLFESGGFVTSSGLALVCAVPFYDFEPRQISAFKYKELGTLINVKCIEFMKALSQVVPNPNCQYDISTVNGSSLRVKYTRKSDKSGFIRKCDNYAAWRFFNPGNLRDSEDKCTTLRTNKSGSFAVFPDERTGFGALEKLLRSEKVRKTKACGTFRYAALTAKEAIHCYCPNADRYNDTEKYIKSLANMGVDVDTKVLRDYTIQEMQVLREAIAVVEGYYTGERVCPKPEHF
jgi:hypothetical protein